MVRPFLRWIVSAEAAGGARINSPARIMTRGRIQAHSSNGGRDFEVTKVLTGFCSSRSQLAAMIVLGALLAPCAAQSSARSTAATPAQTGGTNAAEALYLQLGQVTIDPSRVYRVREAAIDRPSFQITLEDGTIAFTEDVMGHVTGAFFEGDGEILLTPPDEVERRSLSLFTRMAILEERFATAYFRFNDDTVSELAPNLRAVKIVQPKTAPAQGTQKKDEEDQDE